MGLIPLAPFLPLLPLSHTAATCSPAPSPRLWSLRSPARSGPFPHSFLWSSRASCSPASFPASFEPRQPPARRLPSPARPPSFEPRQPHARRLTFPALFPSSIGSLPLAGSIPSGLVPTARGWRLSEPSRGSTRGNRAGQREAAMTRGEEGGGVWGTSVGAVHEARGRAAECMARVWELERGWGTPSRVWGTAWVGRDLSVGHGVGAVHGPSAGPGRRALLSLGMARVWDAACVGRGRGVLHGLSVGHGRGVLHCLCVGHSWGVMHGFCVGRGKGVAHGVSAARGEGGAHRLPVFGTWRGLGAWIVGGARQR
ncbi:hypothetical protein CYMTET_13546 [Cymbomonas tetramitiformis]|uniref:Uncharacterized protein n=1 Tax=Cymbomonas tetramitiformis TaxID=36881 RepID=A0AAE0LB32_9CHLO|nr:hypothetical protein CYMTET_13546 [Cymbomonas tetramitiformis]